MKIKILLISLCLMLTAKVYAKETVTLKSGVSFSGEITERTDLHIKLDTGRNVIMIKLKDIENSINESTTAPLSVDNVQENIESSKDSIEPVDIEPQKQTSAVKEIEKRFMDDTSCKNIAASLLECIPYNCSKINKKSKKTIVEYKVFGIREDACYLKQTSVNIGGTLRCKLTSDTQQKLSENVDNKAFYSSLIEKTLKNQECKVSY
ncbi:MAG: hypothetical protein P9X22_06900 [Candidatus Zapsychrus exili]|nr:hypothetical protein [Candidatus Zapsychrus exili]